MTQRIALVCWAAVLAVQVLRPAPASSFQFDVWKSGTKEDKVVALAKENGVSLSSGSFLGQMLSRKDEQVPDRVEQKGEMKLLGYDAKLLFSFTPETRLLHTVDVEISLPLGSKEVDVEVLGNAIAKQLDKKYKEGAVPPPERLLDLFADKLRGAKKRAWEDARDLIVMESDPGLMGGNVKVIYADKKLVEKSRVEDVRIREKHLEKTGGKDKEKF